MLLNRPQSRLAVAFPIHGKASLAQATRDKFSDGLVVLDHEGAHACMIAPRSPPFPPSPPFSGAT